jgi:hypothetical protein
MQTLSRSIVSVVWSGISYRLSLHRLRTDPTENTACIVDEACLLLGCLEIDVLLLSAIVCCGDMLTGPLPSNDLFTIVVCIL